MKIALCFFGITRSLKYNIKSIEKKIFDELKREKIDFEIYLHTYKHNNYVNKRTEENCDNVDNEEYNLLNPKYLQIDNQDEIKQSLDLEKYRTHDDPWKTNYNSVDNFILAQYSKLQINNMIQTNKKIYDFIIYLRPDVYYMDTFNTDFLKNVCDNAICCPDFHLYSDLNDRFGITNMKTYLIYGNIFQFLYDYSKKEKLHSETIISSILKENNIDIVTISFHFLRIRIDGSIEKLDKKRFSDKIEKCIEEKTCEKDDKIYIILD